jgi:hypothetical protein
MALCALTWGTVLMPVMSLSAARTSAAYETSISRYAMALLLSASLARLQYWQPDVVKMATWGTDAGKRHDMLS